MANPHSLPACPFCQHDSLEIIERSPNFFVVYDKTPVTPGHSLIIPYRHYADAFALSPDELVEVWGLVQKQRQKLLAADPEITGFNLGFNSGIDAGQTIFHVHIHLIPRRHGDVEKPRGGVRGVIPARQNY